MEYNLNPECQRKPKTIKGAVEDAQDRIVRFQPYKCDGRPYPHQWSEVQHYFFLSFFFSFLFLLLLDRHPFPSPRFQIPTFPKIGNAANAANGCTASKKFILLDFGACYAANGC
jgi:hypothetical protein